MIKRSTILLLVLAASAAAHGQTSSVANWVEKVTVGGDIRLRHDYNSKAAATDTSEAHKERMRVRLGVVGKINDDITGRVRLATAENQSTNSTNQSMTDNGNKKGIYVDLAMIDWKISDGSSLLLGKMENPLRPIGASQLVYDTDYTPEGAALTNKFGSFFINAASYVIQERAPQSTSSGTSEPDSWMLGGVTGLKSDLGGDLSLMVAAGYHNFTAIKKNAALSGGFLGNTNTGAGAAARYDHDYQVGELALELKWKLDETAGFTLFADAIQNFYLEEDNRGLLTGLQYQTLNGDGKADWTLTYGYMTLDKDATISAANNSDWANGNDGAFGHMGQVSKLVATNTTFVLTWHWAKIDNNGQPYDSDRAFADLIVTF